MLHPVVMLPDLSQRIDVPELMDDFSITDHRLEEALRDLRYVNRYLGGVRVIRSELEPLLRHRSLRILDVGTGIADIPEQIVRWADESGYDVHFTAVDANPATIAVARKSLSQRLKPSLRQRVVVRTDDALNLECDDASFDVATASLFLHHFRGEGAVRVLREMNRVASCGIIVNDLHRHPLAYVAVRSIAAVMPVSEMFGHDGPASVRRGFNSVELRDLAAAAGLAHPRIRRAWAFRLVLSTLPE